MNACRHIAGDLKKTANPNLLVMFGEPDIDAMGRMTVGVV
jgi:hypothetical protein